MGFLFRQVEEVVLRVLLPKKSPRLKAPLSVEAVRVYLLLPELLRVLVKRERGAEQATLAVADALLHAHTLLGTDLLHTGGI